MPGKCEQVRSVEGQIKGKYELESYKLQSSDQQPQETSDLKAMKYRHLTITTK